MRFLVYAFCLVFWITVATLRSALSGGPVTQPGASDTGPFPPAKSLDKMLYLEKAHRLVMTWDNRRFEIWDTQHGRRLGRVERLARRTAWIVGSPDEATILVADRMPFASPLDPEQVKADSKVMRAGFIPSVSVWDAKSGVRKHSIPVSRAETDGLWTREWYARWLDNSRVLLVRLWRENPVRAASWLELIIVDTAAGEVVRSSERLRFGEHVFLSPDGRMALVKDDNFAHRGGVLFRNIYARTHVIDLESFTVVSSWREPPDSHGEEKVALIARWCPDGKTVLTVDSAVLDGHLSPRASLRDARSGQLLQSFVSGHTDLIMDVALTATGDKLLTASEDRTLRVWSTRTGKSETVLAGHAAGLNKVIVLPGDKLAVSAAEETVAKVWDLTTGKLKFDLPGHDSAVRELEQVSESVVRTVTHSGTATIWDCSTGMRLRVIPKPPEFPTRFGMYELVDEEGTLQMRALAQPATGSK